MTSEGVMRAAFQPPRRITVVAAVIPVAAPTVGTIPLRVHPIPPAVSAAAAHHQESPFRSPPCA